MKNLKVLLLLAAVSFGFACEARADLNLDISFGGGHRHSYYEQRHVRYYDEPVYRSYRPRRRIVRYYQEPVYYAPRRSYYRSDRCD